MSDPFEAEARQALDAYALEAPLTLRRFGTGLINQTFLVETHDQRWVLQRLHPIFGADVHLDIEAITAWIAARGLVTPRLLRTRDGALHTIVGEGVWRVMSFVAGHTLDQLRAPAEAEAAAELVARFHGALADCPHQFHFRRAGVHDTERHLANLVAAVDAERQHARHAEVARLAEALAHAWSALRPMAATPWPQRVVHGDLKISNVLFADEPAPRAVCLVDLDTLAHLPIVVELGDAWRSWCNPAGENTAETRFDLDLLAAAWRGYARHAGGWLTPAERQGIVGGIALVCVELAARFAADALQERYFGWDPTAFASRSEHNFVRASGQLNLYRSLTAQRAAAEHILST